MLELDEHFLRLLPGLSLKLGVAIVCGLLLGIERERKDKPAGVRTITLITTGAALFLIVSELIVQVAEGDPASGFSGQAASSRRAGASRGSPPPPSSG